ncbi:MAG: hypothetical protein JW876_09205 [Candidatus Krumholzibacteriota bacterium]|nr:hypothetical protein [Candidatus Krumholzibacteriota bacterium]
MHSAPRTASRVLLAALAILFVALLAGCSKDDDPVAALPGGFLMVYHEGDSSAVFFADLPSFDVEGLDAILLDAFVDTFLVPPYYDRDQAMYDSRPLYAYRIEGEDGFSASVKGYPDNAWEHLELGYLLVAARQVVFPDDVIDLPGAYNVKDAARVIVLRKFDVVYADTTAVREIADLSVVQVENHDGALEDAVRLSDLVETTIVPDPSTMQYNIVALDGYGPSTPMSWAEFGTGYWLLDSKRTIFTDPDLSTGAYELRVLEQILVQ